MHQNRITVMGLRTANSWRLIATKQQVALSEIRGRWYESMRMLPIINGDDLDMWSHSMNEVTLYLDP